MQKRKHWVVATFLSLLLMFTGTTASYAAAQENTNFHWEKSTYVYGAGLNDSEIESTLKGLGATDDEVNRAVVNAADMKKYVNWDSHDYNMISSVVVTKVQEGSGISVKISPENSITKITAAQYANAAITAGAKDLSIVVGAVRPVTGESALTGVYKAIDVNGETLDTARTAVANEELITVNEIAEEHKGEGDFTSGKLDEVIIAVKQKLQENKEETGQTASQSEIQQMIDDAVQKAGLQNIITNVNITNLVNFFQNFQNTSAIDSDAVKEQLQKLGSDISENVGNLGNAIGDKAGELGAAASAAIDDLTNKAQDSGIMGTIQNIIDAIVAFFKSIFDAIANFFNSIL